MFLFRKTSSSFVSQDVVFADHLMVSRSKQAKLKHQRRLLIGRIDVWPNAIAGQI